MPKTLRRARCVATGHVNCAQAGDGWEDVFCLRCGERSLVFNRHNAYVGNNLLSHREWLGLLAVSLFIIVAGRIFSGEVYFYCVGAGLAVVAAAMRMIAIRDEGKMAKGDWEFCDTSGCTLGKGHGGECVLAKGR